MDSVLRGIKLSGIVTVAVIFAFFFFTGVFFAVTIATFFTLFTFFTFSGSFFAFCGGFLTGMLRGTNAAPGGIVFGLYSLGQDVPGTDWGFGFLLHVGLFQHFLTLNGVADSEGRVTFSLPLPDAPNLVGAKLHAQAVFSFAGAPCGQLPLLLSSSHGLTLTLHE